MRFIIALLALPAFSAVAFAADPSAPITTMKTGYADLEDAKGASIGHAVLRPGPKGLLLRLEAKGLTPGWHGMHLHEKGDCSDAAAGFKMSGAHMGHGNGVSHGLLNSQGPEGGDMPNLFVGADGTANAEIYLEGVTLDSLMDSDGTAIIVHAKEDDQTSQPIGGAGERVACGVVKIAQ